jgi:DUF438 domain-containing protein
MSELIDNARQRKDLLKQMIRQLHAGETPDEVRPQLVRLLGRVPYGDVVESEQELIREGLPPERIQDMCDLHSAAVRGLIDLRGVRNVPEGHPVHTFRKENEALAWEIKELQRLYDAVATAAPDTDPGDQLSAIRVRFNALMDVDKHYLRKEYLLFPYLEQHGITGPPKVMWGKHDGTRAALRAAIAALEASEGATIDEARDVIRRVLAPASASVASMIEKEEHILVPLCLDILNEAEWYEIARESAEIGFCLYDPPDTWRPAGTPEDTSEAAVSDRVRLPSGSLTPAELTAIFNTIPFDLTFVDRDDTVRYFTQGRERIFSRSRAILGRKVQYCHPPSSVKVVEQILEAFKSGARDHAAFWITMKGRFLSIEYFALRGANGEYLGCLEVSQDLTEKRALTGEQRLLSWRDT